MLNICFKVNSELKTLLVAAVGEDLETRVQHLTEDKLQLARALLNSANHLTSHQEQTEWLSGQCEVWRSKFLASSLMVEELARWKSALTQRVHEFQENTKCLLEERNKVFTNMVKTQQKMLNVLEHLGRTASAENSEILACSESNLRIMETISMHLDVNCTQKEMTFTAKPTVAEQALYQVFAIINCLCIQNEQYFFVVVTQSRDFANETRCNLFSCNGSCNVTKWGAAIFATSQFTCNLLQALYGGSTRNLAIMIFYIYIVLLVYMFLV